jgi:hypothetical protein
MSAKLRLAAFTCDFWGENRQFWRLVATCDQPTGCDSLRLRRADCNATATAKASAFAKATADKLADRKP